ncbi:MAG: hypothetical protein SGI87_10165 [Flavobacteriales bacterium]|nr:hypothetical protein [Flavobacteriales bacterium]
MKGIFFTVIICLFSTFHGHAQSDASKQNGIEIKFPRLEFANGDTLQLIITTDHMAEIEFAILTDYKLLHHQVISTSGENVIIEVPIFEYPIGKVKALLTSKGLHKEVDILIK